MKSKVTLITAAALSLVMSAPLFAQGYSGGAADSSGMGSGTTGSTMPGSAATTAHSNAPDMATSYKASTLMNKQVKNSQGQNLGKLSEVIIDNTGKVSHVVVSDEANKQYAVPWNRITLAPGQADITLNVSKDQLSSEFSAFEDIGTSGSMGTDTSGGAMAPSDSMGGTGTTNGGMGAPGGASQ